MRRFALFIALTCVSIFGFARKFDLGKHRFRLSRTDFADTIQLVIDRQQQILIPVKIGDQTRLFKLDTGSGFGVIYENGAVSHQTVLGDVKSVDGAGQRTSVRTVTLPPFTIGSVEISDYAVTEAPSSVLSRSFRHDAVIGFALFSQGLAAKIDMATKQLIITDRKDFFDAEQGEAIKYENYHYAPYITISPAPGVKLKTLFDTGCSDLYLLDRKDYDKNKKKLAAVTTESTRGRIGIANNGVEREDEIIFLSLGEMQWSDLRFTQIEARTHQGVTSIGRALLRYGALIINPFNRKLIFQPYEQRETASDKNQIAVCNHLPDIYYIPKGHSVMVGLVRTSSPLYKAGLHRGDIILSVNGHTVDFHSFISYPWVKGHTYTFRVQDILGFQKEITIEK